MLRAAAIGWAGIVRSKGWAFDHNLLRPQRVTPVVVSVGNLLVGGTGKTPLAQALATELQARGWRVALVSRGYGGKLRRPHIVSTGSRIVSDVDASGDEAIASAEALRDRAAVVCGADRVAAAQLAHRSLQTQVIVLDDGFQHRRLARDLDLLILPDAAAAARGDLAFLPWGRLREGAIAVRRADFVLHTGPPAQFAAAISAQLPRVRFELEPRRLVNLEGQPVGELESLAGQPVATLTAIARPERLVADLRRAGARVVMRRELADHARFPAESVGLAVAQARDAGARVMVTTTKDAVKLRRLGAALTAKPPFQVLERKVRWSDGTDLLWERLEQIMKTRCDAP